MELTLDSLACGSTGDLWDADANATSIQQLLGALLSLMGGSAFRASTRHSLTERFIGMEEPDQFMVVVDMLEEAQLIHTGDDQA